jgi:hypothetical protein
MSHTSSKASSMEGLAAILSSAALYGWEVRQVRQTSDQLYLIFDQLESLRRVETETFQVQIYLLIEKDGRQWLGESGCTANPGGL